MTLLRSEIERISHRRLTRVAGVVLLGWVAVAGTMTFLSHSSQIPDMARAEMLAAENTTMCLASYEINSYGMSDQEIADNCVSDPAWFVEDTNFHLQSMLVGNGSGNGNESFAVAREHAMERSLYPELGAESSASGLSSTLAALGVLLVLGAGLLGASFVGADWRSGVIESQLVRQPNRIKLFGAKFGAIALTTGLMASAAAALTMISVLPAAIWRGDTTNTGPDFWLAVASMIGRIGLAGAAVAVVTGAITMVARNTAAGVGVGLVTFIVGGMFGAMEGAWTPFVGVPQNLNAWISQGDVGYTFIKRTTMQSEYYQLLGHDWIAAGVLMSLVAVGFVALGVGSFVRRDVS